MMGATVLLLTAGGTADASARANMRDAANGIRIATGKNVQKTGLFADDTLQSLDGLCAHANFCAGNLGVITVQASGDVLRLYIEGRTPPGYKQLCAAALAGLAPADGLEQTTALVEAAFAVAELGTTATNQIGNVTLYVERLGSEPTQCSMVRP